MGDVAIAPPGAFDAFAAERLAGLLDQLAGEKPGPISLVLSGGRTPRGVYRMLARHGGLPWSRMEVFFGDERAVPPSHVHSNYRMARESLLDRVPVPPDRIHRMRAEEADLDEAARAYALLLPGAPDLVLLGIGMDGHTASLFPGAPTLDETERRVVPARSPRPPRARLTVTPRVLREARHLVVLASGAVKSEPVARALEGPWEPAACPAQLALRGSWILDPAAASGLPGPASFGLAAREEEST